VALDPPTIPAGFWRIAFGLVCVLAALWSVRGAQRAPTIIWLLTAVDRGAMAGMWTPSLEASLRWTLV
jgi:hypothetical protein